MRLILAGDLVKLRVAEPMPGGSVIPAGAVGTVVNVQGGKQALALIHWEGKWQMSQVAFANLEHGTVGERFPRWMRITLPLLRRPAAAVILAFVAGVGGFVGGFVANRTFGH